MNFFQELGDGIVKFFGNPEVLGVLIVLSVVLGAIGVVFHIINCAFERAILGKRTKRKDRESVK